MTTLTDDETLILYLHQAISGVEKARMERMKGDQDVFFAILGAERALRAATTKLETALGKAHNKALGLAGRIQSIILERGADGIHRSELLYNTVWKDIGIKRRDPSIEGALNLLLDSGVVVASLEMGRKDGAGARRTVYRARDYA